MSRISALALILCLSTPVAFPAGAETLDSVLKDVNRNNNGLKAKQSAVLAAAEGINQAKAGYLPHASASASSGYNYLNYIYTGFPGNQNLVPRSVGVQIVQKVYDGNETDNQVARAQHNLEATKSNLEALRSSLFFQAITVCADINRDAAIEDLMEKNIDVLNEQLRQTQKKYSVGDADNTQLAQIEAQLALGSADLTSAKGNLEVSKNSFEKLVGRKFQDAVVLTVPAKQIPATPQAAFDLALKSSPQIQALIAAVDAADKNILIERAARSPTASLVGSAQHQWDTQFQNDETVALSVIGQVSMSIFDGGLVNAREGAAVATRDQTSYELDTAKTELKDTIFKAYELYQNAIEREKAVKRQVEAAQIALDGMRLQVNVGQGTILDLLISHQNLLSAQVNLTTAQHDEVVYSYQILSLIDGIRIH